MSAALTPRESGTWAALAGPGAPGLAIDPRKPVVVVRVIRPAEPT